MRAVMAFYRAVIGREWHKMLRQKDRLASALVRPLLWLWVIGGGMSALAGPDYIVRLLPGIVAMTLLFGGMVGGMSLALDKDAGTMRLLVSAPVRGVHVLLAKCIAAAINAGMQCALLLFILLLLDGIYSALHAWVDVAVADGLRALLPWVGRTQWPTVHGLLAASAVSALCCAALGLLCGVMTKTIDGFAVMMNFVIFPVFFFSGALYPVNGMPVLARWLSLCNPFTYVVDLIRHVFGVVPEHALWMDVSAVAAGTLILLAIAAWRFSRSGAAHLFRM